MCEPKSAGLQPIRDKLPQLKGANLRSRQDGGPNGRDKWRVDPTELTMEHSYVLPIQSGQFPPSYQQQASNRESALDDRTRAP